MIQVIKGEPLSIEVRARVDRHPLGVAAHVMRTIGLAAVLVGLTLMTDGALLSYHLALPIGMGVPLGGFGTGIVGAVLLHQGTELGYRVIRNELGTPVEAKKSATR
ncbi:hypothetical protein PP564_24105 [Mycobacteroides abscessus]|nr:hypothetical protein [Mycobacteroides abscessus]MDM2516248.1 hypothetical protein [Mycobacteroides abscessus]MDM2525762.1 hypothetical protein [Mycobacteroides abscessus]MDM2535240.1 hypothetical protein [Mycobacteroides abscessus]MDM2714857.1 hypothetical protein [Mycobacteroides abscessus]